MNIHSKGQRLRSRPLTFSSGDTLDVDLQFLHPAMRAMQAPCVHRLLFHLRLNMAAAGGATAGEDGAACFSRISAKDRGGVFVDLAGKIARAQHMAEYGQRVFQEAAVSSAGTNTTYDIFVPVHLAMSPEKSYRPQDTSVELNRFVDGGEISVAFATPANFSITSGTARVYADVIDERIRESKARRVQKHYAITAIEDDYKVGGSLRSAYISSNLGTTTGYTALSGVTSIDSEALRLQDFDPILLKEFFRQETPDVGSENLFTIATADAIPLVMPGQNQKIGQMPDLGSFDVNLVAVPTSGQMVVDYIEDRKGSLAAEWHGYSSTADYADAVKTRGEVAARGGGNRAVTAWDPKLARRLPVRIPRGRAPRAGR